MKIATIFCKFDYGIEARGPSNEIKYFYPAIKKLYPDTAAFWIENHGFPSEIDRLQKEIIYFCQEEKPDIVFMILMTYECHPMTLKTLRSMGIKVVNWFCDDHWRFDGFSSQIAPDLDFAATVDKYSVNRYAQYGCKGIHSQWASNYIRDYINTDYLYDISFVGSPSRRRVEAVNLLCQHGFKVQCWGTGWPNGRADQTKMQEIFLMSKINLNLSNSEDQKNIEQIKARTFEIPACGGFQLSQFALEVEDYFTIGKEIAVYSSPLEMLRQVDYYLTHDEEREKIKLAGWTRAKEYTYENRMREVFNEIRNSLG